MSNSKHALITGASGGLGSCLVDEYIRRGYQVFGGDIVVNSKIEALRSQYPDSFRFITLNVADDASVDAALAAVAGEVSALDVIVNTVGILPANSANKLEAFEITQALDVFNVNSLGPLRVIKAFLTLLKNGEDKVLVNISSEAGSLTTHNPNYIHRFDYCMSKAALNMQSIILQRYLKPDGIKVLAVHPGWMKTEMGGSRAPVAPEDSARGIADLAALYRHQLDEGIYFDYDGSSRAW